MREGRLNLFMSLEQAGNRDLRHNLDDASAKGERPFGG